MSCLHLYDFISGSRITLAAPPCQAGEADNGGGEILDIVRPNAESRAMVERHLNALAAVPGHDGAAGKNY